MKTESQIRAQLAHLSHASEEIGAQIERRNRGEGPANPLLSTKELYERYWATKTEWDALYWVVREA